MPPRVDSYLFSRSVEYGCELGSLKHIRLEVRGIGSGDVCVEIEP